MSKKPKMTQAATMKALKKTDYYAMKHKLAEDTTRFPLTDNYKDDQDILVQRELWKRQTIEAGGWTHEDWLAKENEMLQRAFTHIIAKKQGKV